MIYFSTLLLNFCHKKQEITECSLKLCGYINHHGTYTHQAGNRKGTGFYRLPVLVINVLFFLNKKKEMKMTEVIRMQKDIPATKLFPNPRVSQN